VWAAIREIQEAHKDMVKNLEKSSERVDRQFEQIEKAHEQTERTLEQTIGRLGNRLGDMAEHMLVPGLPEKFKQHGFTFSSICRNKKMNDNVHNIHTEIDVLLENGSQAMAVEVKVTLRPEDVNDHIKRMEKIRAYADLHEEKRQYFGALAATVIDEDVKTYALKQGFYVIEPSGEDVQVTSPFSPARSW
jgi:hypothetical protein